MILQELALWATVGALLNVVGYPWDTWQFWCFLATYWAVSHVSRTHGRVQGIIHYLEMSTHEQARIQRALKEAKGDTDA
jgi:hypothetical protein